MMYLYFFVITFSLVGYGFLANNFLKIKVPSFGILGLLGVTLTALISYFSAIFFKHGYLFNSLFIIIGVILFLINLKKIQNFKREFFYLVLVFSVLLIFISVGKNHDDFPYYHFPYISVITEYSHPIGFGQLNNGFRSPSSIFFISSMFYLPYISVYLFHIAPALILGFSNLVLLNKIIDQKIYDKIKFINFLSLSSLIFINIFFYRLAEHGTDRSGMILIILALIFLLYLINNNNSEIYENENTDVFKIFAILICFVISIKPSYLINLTFFLVLLNYSHSRKIFKNLLFSNSFSYCFLFIIFTVFYTFINSGCLIFPLAFSCFENVSWSIGKDHVSGVKLWFELWSKAGATPHYVVPLDGRANYVAGLTWLPNWFEIYFFNKVSDFILGLIALCSIIVFSFYDKLKSINKKKIDFIYVYIILFIFLMEWFFYHPQLRYGGYHLIALMFIIPTSLWLGRIKIKYKDYYKKMLILISITLIIFLYRNGNRILNEYNQYKYNPLLDSNYKFIGADKKYHLRYNEHMKKNINKYDTINILGKKIINTTYPKK